MPATAENPDWTTGPAKWAAVALLGLGAATGMTWSMFRPPARPVPPTAPALVIPAAPGDGEAAPPAAAGPRRININTASRAELELLPGIGPAVAQRIIDHREANGPFASVNDLDNVKGIGPRTLEKLRDLICAD